MKGRGVFGSLLLVIISTAGCGGSGSSGGGTACTLGTGTSRSCYEIYASTATSASIAMAESDCTNGGGVVSKMCSHEGANGGCKTGASQGGVTASSTIWYYSGDAAAEMQDCINNGDTWIAP